MNKALAFIIISICLFCFTCEKSTDSDAPWYKQDVCSGDSPYNIQYSWTNTDLTPAFRFDLSLPSSWRNQTEYAASAWNNANSRLQIKVNRTVVSRGAYQDGYNVVSHDYIGTKKLGECRIWIRSGTNTIVEADIILNSHYELGVGASESFFDVRSVLAHEFGHFCGLNHVSDRTHTMYPECPKNCTIYRSLCDGDILGMLYNYGSK